MKVKQLNWQPDPHGCDKSWVWAKTKLGNFQVFKFDNRQYHAFLAWSPGRYTEHASMEDAREYCQKELEKALLSLIE